MSENSAAVAATAKHLTDRSFAQTKTTPSRLPIGAGTWERGAVYVLEDIDGSWKCGTNAGKDCMTLDSFLDTTHPTQESYRIRIENAYRKIGL